MTEEAEFKFGPDYDYLALQRTLWEKKPVNSFDEMRTEIQKKYRAARTLPWWVRLWYIKMNCQFLSRNTETWINDEQKTKFVLKYLTFRYKGEEYFDGWGE